MSIWQDNVVAFTSRTETRGLDEYVDAIITAAVHTATAHYLAGQPGRGEFVLQRLALRLQRLEREPEVPQ